MSEVSVKTATRNDGDDLWAVLFDEAERLDIWVTIASSCGEFQGFYINTNQTGKTVFVNTALPQGVRNQTLKNAIDCARSEKNDIPLIFVSNSEGSEQK